MFERFSSNDSKFQGISPIGATSGDATRVSIVEALSTASMFVFFVLAVVFLSVLMSSVAKAQTASLANDPATLAAEAEDSTNPQPIKYGGQLVFETTRTADEAQPASYSGWYLFTGSATHKKTATTATARVGYTREYSYQRDDGTDGSFDNPTLSLAKSYRQGPDFSSDLIDSFSISTAAAIGANKESARRTFLWSNGLTATVSKNLGRFNLREALSYTHAFFEYDIRADGTVNSPDSVRTLTMVYYDISDRLSVGGTFIYSYAVSFQGVGRGAQIGQVTLDYSFNDKVAASIGIASERSTIEPDGQSDRIRLYAPEAAQYFVDLIYTL